jgi:2-oxoglutarate ferredoxin oxidoreductase subunit gamma
MQSDVIISGFGGQGVLFAGQLLAYAALDHGYHVTWFPSYGPEMRGGTAHCTVIIADEEIGAPLVRRPETAIVMNQPSLDKYEPLVVDGGLIIINSSLVNRQVEREDLDVVLVPANDLAEELGESRLANMILIGAMLGRKQIFSLDQINASLEAHIPEHRRDLLGLNYEALQKGFEIGAREVAA